MRNSSLDCSGYTGLRISLVYYSVFLFIVERLVTNFLVRTCDWGLSGVESSPATGLFPSLKLNTHSRLQMKSTGTGTWSPSKQRRKASPVRFKEGASNGTEQQESTLAEDFAGSDSSHSSQAAHNVLVAPRSAARWGLVVATAGSGVSKILHAVRVVLGVTNSVTSSVLNFSKSTAKIALSIPSFLTSRLLLPVERVFLANPVLSPYLLRSLDLSRQLAELSLAALDGTVNISLGTISAIAGVLEDFVSPNGAASSSHGMVAALLAFLHLVRRETLLHPEVRQVGILQLLRGIVAWMVIQGMTRTMWTAALRGVRPINVGREKRLSLRRKGRHHNRGASIGTEGVAGSLQSGSSLQPLHHSRNPSGGSTWSQWSRATNYTATNLQRTNSFRASSSLNDPSFYDPPDSAFPDDESDVGPSISARGDSPNFRGYDSEVEDLPPFELGPDYPTWQPSSPRDIHSIQRDYGFLPPPRVASPDTPLANRALNIDDLLTRLSALDAPVDVDYDDDDAIDIPDVTGELEVVLTQREEQGEMDLVEGYIPGPAVEFIDTMDIDEPEPVTEYAAELGQKLSNRRSMLSMKSSVSFVSDAEERMKEGVSTGDETKGTATPVVMVTDDPIDAMIAHVGGPLDLRRIRRYATVSTGAYGAGLNILRVLYDRTFGAAPAKEAKKKTDVPPERRFSAHFEGRRPSRGPTSGASSPLAETHPAEHHLLASHAGTRLSAIIHSSFMDDQPEGLGNVLRAIFEPEKGMPAGVNPVGPMRSSHSEPGEMQGMDKTPAPAEDPAVPPLPPPESWNHPTFYILADRPAKAIVVVLRGTASLSEVMVDMTCEYEEMALDPSWTAADAELFRRDAPNGGFKVHGGILKAARHLAARGSKFLRHLAKALEENRGYGLTLVGHSLGAGLASLLGCMWVERGRWMTRRGTGLPEGRRVKVFAYGGFTRKFVLQV